jgi:hypothetical protein
MTPSEWIDRFCLFFELLCVPAQVNRERLAAIAREQYARQPQDTPEWAARSYYLTGLIDDAELFADIGHDLSILNPPPV